jgi:hypothetical protein
MPHRLENFKNRVNSIHLLLQALGKARPATQLSSSSSSTSFPITTRVVRVCIWLTRDPALEVQSPEVKEPTFLYLAASAARKGVDITRAWRFPDCEIGRIPVEEPIIGRIATTRTAAIVREQKEWPVFPDWAASEKIISYLAAPMVNNVEPIGVLAAFLDEALDEEGAQLASGWLDIVASQVAGILAASWAFEEIARLKGQLELESDYLREEIHTTHSAAGFVGQSPALKQVLRACRPLCPDGRHYPDPRRIGHGQRTRRPGDPREQPAQLAPSHQGQLRVHSEGPFRERILRARQRLIHWSDPGPDGSFPARQQRHVVPG